ncbi:MAG TPA: ABC transporter ATP-binding protein [Solirubrobacteraceae bacterium]|nr:ABC transporter ATP-binding protein [Solirubrobacteraceae bacterium]
MLLGEWRAVLTVITIAALQAVTLAPVPLLVGRIFSKEIPTHNSGQVIVDGVIVLLAYAVSTAVALLSRAVVLRLAGRIIVRLRSQLIERLYALPTDWHGARDDGRLPALVSFDGERTEYLVIAALTWTAAALVGLPVLGAALVLGPVLVAVLAVAVPLTLAVTRALDRQLMRISAAWREESSRHHSAVTVALRTLGAARVHAADDDERRARLAEIVTASVMMRRKNSAQATCAVMHGTVTAIAGVLVLFVGGAEVASGHLSLGRLMEFYAVLGLGLRQLATAAGQWPTVVAGRPSLQAILDVIDDRTPPDFSGSVQATLDGSVSMRGVRFGYGATAVLRGIDFEIDSGETVALVGPNGSGKSTLLRLLLGLRQADAGTIALSGHELSTLDLRHARSQIGVVQQDPVLLPRGIWANVCWGNGTPDESAVRAAAGIAQLDDIDGWDDRDAPRSLGDRGVQLSGGQAQRIVIARAMVGSPSLVVLDEPTNHLDAATVAKLTERLRQLDPRPAVLLVTHVAEVAAIADRQVLLDNGRITALEGVR